MLGAKERGPAVTATPKPKQQRRSYSRYVLKSSTKIKDDLGTLLWSLQFEVDGELEQVGWQTLERLLRKYVDVAHTRRKR
jgi:hypothetical protein